MTRRIIRGVMAVLLASNVGGASWARASEPSGRVVYLRYCASCHGADGKGDGPVTASLKQPPPDLTTLAQRAGGRVDERQLMAVIDGRRHVAAHGPRDMPVWGAVFDEELKEQPYAGYTTLLRSKVLAEYLLSIQK